MMSYRWRPALGWLSSVGDGGCRHLDRFTRGAVGVAVNLHRSNGDCRWRAGVGGRPLQGSLNLLECVVQG